jgi:hypothetical protein
MANGPKGLTSLAAVARSGCHTAPADLAARARRERADRGTVTGGGWAKLVWRGVVVVHRRRGAEAPGRENRMEAHRGHAASEGWRFEARR